MVPGLQLEIEVENLAQLEAFWGRIPPQAHKAWGQRAQVQHPCQLGVRCHSYLVLAKRILLLCHARGVSVNL